MTFFIALATTFLFGTGFFLICKKGLLNRAFGLLLISHGANFVILSMGGLTPFPMAPIITGGQSQSIADPLPQALILTALVIGFSVAAFLWALVLRLRKED